MENIMRIAPSIKNQKSKIKNFFLFCMAMAFTLASCEIEEPTTIQITKPLSIADVEFLNAYDFLKTYVDRAANPNFTLSAQTSISDVTDKGLIYRLLASNFDQIVSGGMSHRSIVDDNGAYNFGNIPNLLAVASDAGISIFGQPLVWHAEQRGEYLNEEIAPETKTEMVWVPGAGGKQGEMLVNGNFADDEWDTSFKANGSAEGALTANGQGPGGQGRALMITNLAVQSDGWRSQMVIAWEDSPMLEGEEWTFKMDYKSDVACDYGNQAQGPIYTWKHNGILPDVSSTTAWQTLEIKFVVEARSKECSAIAFDLGLTATTYYFANVSLYKHASDGRWEEVVTEGVPKTDEEKYEIITAQLEQWIEGMMDVASDYVKDWVVINEPIDDDNPSQLKTGIGKSNIPDSEFYWQDYLGEDYARTAVEFARKHGGAGLKLFVNDYGLVNTAKCQGLIQMIAKWEADGTTKIDGIGAQMSLTCSLDATTQKEYEDQVVEMFNALKETGKLIKISALDMKIAEANGTLINTANVTRAQQLAMAKYYNFVVRKYFEIIPAAQRYGIDVGNPIESTTNTGLWDSNYNRKFTFSGFADGLAGRAASAE